MSHTHTGLIKVLELRNGVPSRARPLRAEQGLCKQIWRAIESQMEPERTGERARESQSESERARERQREPDRARKQHRDFEPTLHLLYSELFV